MLILMVSGVKSQSFCRKDHCALAGILSAEKMEIVCGTCSSKILKSSLVTPFTNRAPLRTETGTTTKSTFVLRKMVQADPYKEFAIPNASTPGLIRT